MQRATPSVPSTRRRVADPSSRQQSRTCRRSAVAQQAAPSTTPSTRRPRAVNRTHLASPARSTTRKDSQLAG